jgi:photosystem II stability/assembly factor-like uncharacterized protein
MTKMLSQLVVALALLTPAYFVGCGPIANHSKILSKTETNEPASNTITDSNWNFRLVGKLPEGKGQRRIRCNKDKLCWVWDGETIWIMEKENYWRQFYSQPSQQRSDTEIKSVSLTSPKTGWVVKGRALYKTEDAGATLQRVPIDEINGDDKGAVASVYFADKERGWIVGRIFEPLRQDDPVINTYISRGQITISCIFETMDGGVTWKRRDLPRRVGSFEEINFWGDKTGVISSRTRVVFTNDGGTSWVDITQHFPIINVNPQNEPTPFLSAFFLDQNTGWLLFSGFKFEVLSTQESGKSWRKMTWIIKPESTDTSSYQPPPRFAFIDKTHGLFIYNHIYGGELFKTSNSGKSWELIGENRSTDEVFFDLFFDEVVEGFIVSSKGVYAFSPQNPTL